MDIEQASAEELMGEELGLTITSDGAPHGTNNTGARTGRALTRVAEVAAHQGG